jgi:hypothetical protein
MQANLNKWVLFNKNPNNCIISVFNNGIKIINK